MARRAIAQSTVRALCLGCTAIAWSFSPVMAQPQSAAPAGPATPASRDIAAVAAYGSEEHLLALWRLGQAAPLTGAELDRLRSVLWDDDWRVRWLALRVVAHNCSGPLPPEDHRALEPDEVRELRQLNEMLPGMLHSAAPEVRALAAQCMLTLGPGSRWPRSGSFDYGDLVAALADPYPAVSEPLKQVLAQWIAGADDWTRKRIVFDMLRALGETGQDGYYTAMRLLKDKHDERLAFAVTELEQELARRIVRNDGILGTFKLTAKQTLPLLAEIAGEGNSPERLAAVDALAALGTQAAPVVPQLGQALLDGDLDLAREALTALSATGPAAAGAAPQMIELMDTDRAYLGSQAARQLGYLGGAAGPDAVLALLRHAAESHYYPEALEAIKAIAPDVYDAFAPQVQALINAERASYRGETVKYEQAKRAWAKVLASPTLRSRVARLWRRNPGKLPWHYVDQYSSQQELALFFTDLAANTNSGAAELAAFLPGWDELPEEAVPALWICYSNKYLTRGWETQPDSRQPELPAIARALAKHDPQAYDKFRLLASDADVNRRRLGLYGLACCGTATADLAPDMMQRLRAAELTPYERALSARVLAVSGATAPYAAELLALLEAAYSDAYAISAQEIVRYGFDQYHWSLDEGAGMLGQTYDNLTTALTEALCTCGPGAASMLLAKVREKYADGSSTSSMSDEQRTVAGRTRRAAMLALGHSGVVLAPPQPAPYPGAPPLLPAEVEVALQWLQVGRPLRYFSHDPLRLQEELRDRAAAADTLGRLGCSDERVLRALLEALQDEVTELPPAAIDPNDWPAKLKPPAMPLRDAAVEALERLAEVRKPIT